MGQTVTRSFSARNNALPPFRRAGCGLEARGETAKLAATFAMCTDHRLLRIAKTVGAGGRVTDEDGEALFECDNLGVLAQLANIVRERKHGRRAFYVINRHINYSNICVLDCVFCAFARRRREPEAYEFTIPEMVERARAALTMGATEIHIVGGLHPSHPFEFYVEMLQALKKLSPSLHLKAFTAIEIRHLARLGHRTMEETLRDLRAAGLDSLTGGGAEVFAPEIRHQICPHKETAEEWLDVHRTAHRLGLRSTATMLFGIGETTAQRVNHLRKLRELQDETGGFTAFLPLKFFPTLTPLKHIREASEEETLKVLAVSRIYLDNFDHIKAYWVSLGLDLAARALQFGADDLDGTIVEEKIYHMAGAQTPQQLTRNDFENAIRRAGFEPAQRDSLYNVIET
jgi:aminodeoxyfutalosine synthase